MRLHPVESHIAEKVHAYTMPRERENSRVKDLPELALLAKVKRLEAAQLRRALDQTFTFRKVQKVPAALPDPPTSWSDIYARMAASEHLEWPTVSEVLDAARRFLEPVLSGPLKASWSPERARWE